MAYAPNYTLGRGKVYFARFTSGETPGPFRYMGNSPEFSLTIESETLDHFSSDAGIREKDDSVPLEVTRSGTLVVDDIQKENVALFFFGSASVETRAAATGLEYNITVEPGYFYQLGLTEANRVGDRGVASVVVTGTGGTPTYVAGTDYILDADRGMIEIVDGGAITTATAVEITYNVIAMTHDRVVSGSEPVEGAMRYIEANPRGQDHDVFLPLVKITPNGDFQFKGDDWRQIPFSIEVLKPGSGEAIYRDGMPVAS